MLDRIVLRGVRGIMGDANINAQLNGSGLQRGFEKIGTRAVAAAAIAE
jgi:hypothetical protein